MAERNQFAGHIVRCHTSLDANQAPRYIRKPGPIRPRASFSRKTISLPIQANQMQCVLACIDANGADDYDVCLHGDLLLVLRSPYRNPLGVGARPVHPILRRGGAHFASVLREG